MAAIKLQLGLLEEAVAGFHAVLKDDPQYVPALKGLAEANLAMARERFEKVLRFRLLHALEQAQSTNR